MDPGDRAQYVGGNMIGLPRYTAGVYWGPEHEPDMELRVRFVTDMGKVVLLPPRLLRPMHPQGDTEDWPV